MGNENNSKKYEQRLIENKIISVISTELSNIDGVIGLKGNVADSIHKSILGTNPLSQGIKMSLDDKDGYTLDLYLIVEYLAKIPQLAWEVQTRIKDTLKKQLNVKVKEINIHIQGTATLEEAQ